MRLRVNRLVYVLLGAALAASLLVSVLVRPEPRLAASEDCYGLCPSVTVLSLSSSTVTYGKERVEKFSVKVSAGAPGTGVPTGWVVVESRSEFLCVVRLYRGKGSCSPADWALWPGSYKIAAYYSGDANFKPSSSGKQTLTVRRHSFRRHRP
jgi:Bacterial Ig-like domain (group 3)